MTGSKGFTIIEAVIVMSIFLFVIGVVITMFVSVVASQRSVLRQQEVLNEMSYVQEYVSKALRMAKLDEHGDCIEDPDGLGVPYAYRLTREDLQTGLYRGIKFINQTDGDACWEFFLDTSNEDIPVLKVLRGSSDDNDALPLTSEDVKIQSIRFAVNGQDATISSGIRGAAKTDESQPRITVVFNVEIAEGGQVIVRPVQTTISQRNLNVPY